MGVTPGVTWEVVPGIWVCPAADAALGAPLP